MTEPEPIPLPERSFWAKVMPLLVLAAGVALGIAVMVVISNQMNPAASAARSSFNQPLESPLEPLVAKRSETPAAAQPPQTAPPVSFDGSSFAAGAVAGRGPSAEAAPGSTPADPASVPAVDGQPPSEISGSLPGGLVGGASPPVRPIVIEGENTAAAPSVYAEYLVPVPELDVEATLQEVRALVKSAGGQVHFEVQRDPNRPELGTELIIGVPKATGEKLRIELLKLPTAREADKWSGPFSERHFRMERFLREECARLESRIGQLKVRYHDDAPIVVETTEALDHLKKAMKAFRRIPVEQEAFKVFVGKAGIG